jgi:uncharacterized membrane protein YgcG
MRVWRAGCLIAVLLAVVPAVASAAQSRGLRGALSEAALVVGAGSSASASGSASAAGATSLTVSVTGLPAGVAARVIVSGPHRLRLVVMRSTVLSRLRPGLYILRAQQVVISRAIRDLPAGSVSYPTKASSMVVVKRGGRASATVIYGTIRSSHTHVLGVVPSALSGPDNDPSAVTVPRRDALGVSAILAAAPSEKLPFGLFDKVTSVAFNGSEATMSLTPATLEEAFPELDVETRVSFNFGPPFASARSARASSALSDVDLSFSHDLIPGLLEGSCGAPPSGWSLSPHGAVRPTLNVSLHKGAFSLLYGELSLTLAGDAGFDATLPSGVHCDLTVPGPKADAVIPIAGVPVPVEGAIDLDISLSLSGAAQVQTDAQLAMTGGVDFHGVYGTPILNVKPKASGSVQIAGGKISMGPEMQVGLGLTDINGHVDDSLDVAAKGSGPGSCEIDIGGSAGVGLDLWTFHPSFTPISPEVAVYHCPSNSGRSGGGSGSSGGGSSGGSDGGGGGSGGGGGLGGGAPGGGAGPVIDAGRVSTCALIPGGRDECWGGNEYGQLGDGTTTGPETCSTFAMFTAGCSLTPVLADGITTATALGTGAGMCVVVSGGSVECLATTPVPVIGVTDATSVSDPCAVLSSGGVECWGDNEFGELGNGTTTDSTTPVPVSGITSATAVSVGESQACALIAGGSVECWGGNEAGQLGDGTFGGPEFCGPSIPCSNTPVPVTGINSAVAISAGAWDTCAVLSDGGVDCWGANEYGQLGDGTTTASPIPVPVRGITSATAVTVGGKVVVEPPPTGYEGSVHTCALLSAGSIDCWGGNGNGQLGDGTSSGPESCQVGPACSLRPVPVAGITNATFVSAGAHDTCAQLTNGHIDCWGGNIVGQLGDGTTMDSNIPVAVTGIP